MAAIAAPTPKSEPITTRAVNFWVGIKSEFKKIIWPTPMQIVGQTIVVVVVVTLMTLLLWGLDNGWRLAISLITPHRMMGG